MIIYLKLICYSIICNSPDESEIDLQFIELIKQSLISAMVQALNKTDPKKIETAFCKQETAPQKAILSATPNRIGENLHSQKSQSSAANTRKTNSDFAKTGESSSRDYTIQSIGIDMAWVAPGSINMTADKRRWAKKNTYCIKVSQEYWIAKKEVTQKEYFDIMGVNPSYSKNGNLPVDSISWFDAMAFCKKLTEIERQAGRLQTGYIYRLPTDAEWEFAARGGTKSKGYRYSGSDNLDLVAWHSEDSNKDTHEGGGKRGNELGIYDMSGNVSEWCYNGPRPSTSDLIDFVGLEESRVRFVCGGSFSCKPYMCEPVSLYTAEPKFQDAYIGFRVVKAVDIDKSLFEKNFSIHGIGTEMVWIAPGKFQTSRDDVVHNVTISKGYWIGKYEVTLKEYQNIISPKTAGDSKYENIPIAQITWNDAVDFCEKLTLRERQSGRLPGEYVYRLPTEAEWEFAARGGLKSKGYTFSGSNNPADVAWYSANSENKTHKIGTKSGNELGIHDMSGNVREFCHDAYDKSFSGRQIDPVALEGSRLRVVRGGSGEASASPDACKLDAREFAGSKVGQEFLGFRFVRAAPVRRSISIHENDFTIQDIDMSMVWVKPGTFKMGSNDKNAAFAQPVHKVKITNGYWIGRYEVTQKQYFALMGKKTNNFESDDRPVNKVSWDDAVAFCRKLTERERRAGRLSAKYVYRLPTEAEWEFAARGGTQSGGYKYSGGNDVSKVAWYSGNSVDGLWNVGTKEGNELGIHDMSGNAYEWCHDAFNYEYEECDEMFFPKKLQYKPGKQVDPSGDPKGSYHIYRGGRYSSFESDCNTASRSGGSEFAFAGFRIVKAVPLR